MHSSRTIATTLRASKWGVTLAVKLTARPRHYSLLIAPKPSSFMNRNCFVRVSVNQLTRITTSCDNLVVTE